MRIQIKELRRFQDKNGNNKISVRLPEGEATCFAGKWNDDWKENDFVEVDYEKKELNGRTFHNLKCPAALRQVYGGGFSHKTAQATLDLSGVHQRLDKIIELLSNSGGLPPF